MNNKEKLSKALLDFKSKYPNVTLADLESFAIGWNSRADYDLISDDTNKTEAKKWTIK